MNDPFLWFLFGNDLVFFLSSLLLGNKVVAQSFPLDSQNGTKIKPLHMSRFIVSRSESRNKEQSLSDFFATSFHTYSMQLLSKICRKLKELSAKKVYVEHLFTVSIIVLKKQLWDFNFLYIFEILYQ